MKGSLHMTSATVIRLRRLTGGKLVGVLFSLDAIPTYDEQTLEVAMPTDAARVISIGERFSITIESEDKL